VQTNSDGKIKKGRIIHLEGGQAEFGDGKIKRRHFEGSIEISSLDRKTTLHSAIKKGYIQAFHQKENTRTGVVPEEDILPEVIVVAYVSPNYGISFSDWMYLQSLFYSSPFDYSSGVGESGGNGGTYYGSLDGSGGSYYGGGGYYYGGSMSNDDLYNGVLLDPLILVDVDTYVNNPAIDIEKYLKCFDAIPDVGSTCSIEIFADIPVDSDPTKLFNWNTESPGHVFLQLKKSNGSQHALQNIGFYPNSNWKSVLDANPVDSKIVDDGEHEFNASLKMSLTPYQLRGLLSEAKALSSMKYDTDQFNCTDFALEIFNYVRTPLEIPRYAVPGGIGTNATRTPQGLYVKLKEMKAKGDVEAPNISIGFQKAWVASSNGPCN
jgi:hypothetical protein